MALPAPGYVVDFEVNDDLNNSGTQAKILKAERSRLYNQVGWEIAREVRPRLYLARDFRHFRQFAA